MPLGMRLSGDLLQALFQQKGGVIGERAPLLIGELHQGFKNVMAHGDGESARLTEGNRHRSVLWFGGERQDRNPQTSAFLLVP